MASFRSFNAWGHAPTRTRKVRRPHPLAKLKDCEVVEIKRLRQHGIPNWLVAAMFRISTSRVSEIEPRGLIRMKPPRDPAGVVTTHQQATPDEEQPCQNLGCPNTFEPRHPRQRFCSAACRLQAFHDRNPTRDLDRRLRRIEERLGLLEAKDDAASLQRRQELMRR